MYILTTWRSGVWWRIITGSLVECWRAAQRQAERGALRIWREDGAVVWDGLE